MDKLLISWNVNGIRAILKKGFDEFLQTYQPEILCLQETKASTCQVKIELPGYQQYWCSADKKGYSGTAIFSKYKPISVRYGFNKPAHDQEGRVITLEFKKFFLVNVYTPNAKPGLKRLDYRANQWDLEFFYHLKNLEKSKPVVFCGDLNVAHKEIDLARPESNTQNPGFSPEERAGFDRLVTGGFVDTFRIFNQNPHEYSWWSYRTRARERNIGWRIDYFCVSESIKERVKSASILQEIYGSDHCPVTMKLDGDMLSEDEKLSENHINRAYCNETSVEPGLNL